jgi:two-component system response regulator
VGRKAFTSGILTALYDEQGQLRGYAKILRDFTLRKQYEERIEALNSRLQWAMTETHHRVKNNLQLICAIIDFQMLGYGDTVPVADFKHLGNQVRTLAAVHEILIADTKEGGDATAISLPALIGKLLSLFQSMPGMPRIEQELEAVRVLTRMGSSLALIANELVTNAIHHGKGSIRITLSAQEGSVALSVLDNGPGFPEGFEATRCSDTGLELVENLTRLDLRGEVRYANRPEGGGCVTVLFRTDR